MLRDYIPKNLGKMLAVGAIYTMVAGCGRDKIVQPLNEETVKAGYEAPKVEVVGGISKDEKIMELERKIKELEKTASSSRIDHFEAHKRFEGAFGMWYENPGEYIFFGKAERVRDNQGKVFTYWDCSLEKGLLCFQPMKLETQGIEGLLEDVKFNFDGSIDPKDDTAEAYVRLGIIFENSVVGARNGIQLVCDNKFKEIYDSLGPVLALNGSNMEEIDRGGYYMQADFGWEEEDGIYKKDFIVKFPTVKEYLNGNPPSWHLLIGEKGKGILKESQLKNLKGDVLMRLRYLVAEDYIPGSGKRWPQHDSIDELKAYSAKLVEIVKNWERLSVED